MKDKSLLVDHNGLVALFFEMDAVVMQVEEGGDTVATAGCDNMDGGGRHAEDGMDFVEGDGVFGDKALLAQAYLLATCSHLASLSGRKTEDGTDSRAGQDADTTTEELETLHRAVVDGSGDYLAQMVRLDDVHDLGTVNASLT